MAIALCEGLIENGISVPGEIAITGYDGCWNAFISSPKITTTCGCEKQLGFMAVSRLHEMMTGTVSRSSPPGQYIRYGTSCGCSPDLNDADRNIETFIGSTVQRCYEQKMLMPSNFIHPITEAHTMEELVGTIYRFSYMLQPIQKYAICLCEDWRFNFENTDLFRENGFSERMILMLERDDALAPKTNQTFPCSELLPELKHPHEPRLVVFTSLYHKTQIFGYMAVTYHHAKNICLDEHFMNWCNAAANGLDALQKKMYNQYVKQQFATLSVHDPSTGLYNKRGFVELLPKYLGKSDHALLLISYPEKNESDASSFIARHTLIANALRLSSDGKELISRFESNVFALLSHTDTDDLTEFANKRLMLLEDRMREFQGAVSNQQLPELLVDCFRLKSGKLHEIEIFIEERLLLLHGQAEAVSSTAGNYMDKLRRLRREILSSPQKDWTIPEIANSIGISVSHFQKMYKIEFGTSCNTDIINARIEKAKWLICHTELRVQEIAAQCGYSDSGHFMRQFRKKVGMSALQYKEKITSDALQQ